MSQCPCCSQPLLRCVRENQIYWFCLDCRQEMPNLESIIEEQKTKENRENITTLNRIYAGDDVVVKIIP